MAVIHGKSADHNYNSVALDGSLRSIDVNIDVDTPDTSCAGDSAKEAIAGMYGWGMEAEYRWNPAASENDAIIFAQILAAAAATCDVTPGGGTPTATNPKYTGSAFVKSYRVSVPCDGVIEARASYQGTSTLTRAVA